MIWMLSRRRRGLALRSPLIISRVIDDRIRMENILGADLCHWVFNVAILSSGGFQKSWLVNKIVILLSYFLLCSVQRRK
jgi:hypothetical protein